MDSEKEMFTNVQTRKLGHGNVLPGCKAQSPWAGVQKTPVPSGGSVTEAPLHSDRLQPLAPANGHQLAHLTKKHININSGSGNNAKCK